MSSPDQGGEGKTDNKPPAWFRFICSFLPFTSLSILVYALYFLIEFSKESGPLTPLQLAKFSLFFGFVFWYLYGLKHVSDEFNRTQSWEYAVVKFVYWYGEGLLIFLIYFVMRIFF